MTVNKVILVGRLGADPETRTSNNGVMVCNLRLATDRRVKVGETWEAQTEWHRVTVFGKTAESVDRWCQKGKQLYIEGRLQTRKWQDKDGADRWSTEVVAEVVQFLGGKEEGAAGGGGGGQSGGYGGGSGYGSSSSEVADDSIPF